MTLNKTDAELFTVDAVKSGDTDVLDRMIANVKNKISANKRGDDNLRIAAAHATVMAARTRDEFSVTKFAKALDTATSNVYLWKRLGSALIDLGIEPGSDEWAMLNAIGNRAPMSWALDGLDFSTIKIDANGKPTIKSGSGTGIADRETFDKVTSYLYPDGYRNSDGDVNRALSAEKVNESLVADYGSEAEQAELRDAAEAERLKRAKESVRFLTDNLGKIDFTEVEKAFGEMLKAASAARRVAEEKKTEAALAKSA